MRQCEIFHVKLEKRAGWKWRAVLPGGQIQACKEIYDLFYECVTAARREGYDPVPALKCR